MAKIVLTGYCSSWSARPGETIDFMVSAEGTGEIDVQMVRLIHGDENPDGPGFMETEVDGPINGRHSVRRQFTQMGNFATVDDPDGKLALDKAFTIWAYIWPTMPGQGRQSILSRWSIPDDKGYALGINDKGELEFWVGDGDKIDSLHAEVPLRHKQWYLVAISHDPGGSVTLYQEPVINRYGNLLSTVVPLDMSSHVSEPLRIKPADAGSGFLWGGAHDHNEGRGDFVGQLYNGKIDRCGVIGRALSRAELDALRKDGPPADATVSYTHLTLPTKRIV